jgi:hypothetical protein
MLSGGNAKTNAFLLWLGRLAKVPMRADEPERITADGGQPQLHTSGELFAEYLVEVRT